MGFKQAKVKLLQALSQGTFLHEARNAIEEKNLLSTGDVSVEDVIAIVNRCNGAHHTMSAHHQVPGVTVHVLKRDGWYIKFYFIDPDTYFISVHQSEP